MKCAGKGCSACEQTGEFQLTQCPLRFVDAETFQVVNLASIAKTGQWPINGGMLDQTQWCVDAFQFAISEIDRTVNSDA